MKKYLFVFILFVLLLVTSAVFAQGDNGNHQGGGNNGNGIGNGGGSTSGGGTSGGVPLDGGLSLLLAAGVGYGAKKVMDMRKNTAKASLND